ncbi:hypothetical protein SAMN05428997_1109 [Bosea sp. CRIB-10]|uniref:DNA polymerase III subunit epsilon n=1 Tax=Bosea sp. CRIB-10 TaxID=378404 RepID=UPI0008F185EF|nr:DNA polymerase III subunit epsilon [Bosea sp. CRIB-10]SFC68984.1 hypothetical protein SAMN05428997_1109 [Bosea sp. CRIB-10]
MPPYHVVTDCEFDGPTPGINSMLSFGSVAVSADGAVLGEFEAVLEPLDGAMRDEITMAFWARHPLAWAAATEKPELPAVLVRRFGDWLGAIEGEPIFAAHPLALDGLWFDYCPRRFIGRPLLPWAADRLFRHPPLCLMSFVAGKTGRQQGKCDVQHYPAEWLGSVAHTHRAIEAPAAMPICCASSAGKAERYSAKTAPRRRGSAARC